MTKIENGINTPKEVQEYFESIKGNHAALRQFFTAMPKGGDVHNHLTGSAYAETYFELAASKGMFVNLETGKLYKEKPEDVETIQLSKDMDDLHNHRMALIDKWSIRNFQPYKYPLGPDEYFFGTFGLLSALTSIPDYDNVDSLNNLAYLMHELKGRAVRENVQYLEVIGIAPIIPKNCFLDEEYEKYDNDLKGYIKKDDYTNTFLTLRNIFNKFEDSKEADENANRYLSFVQDLENKSNTFKNYLDVHTNDVMCCYQGYAVRGLEPIMVFAQLYVVYKACVKDNGKLLVGCNIVAAEDSEKSMMYYSWHMEMFGMLYEHYSSVKTSLHAGELTMGLVRPEHLTYHISQAVLKGSACRIGHGVDMPFEEDSGFLHIMQINNTPVEINLTSNEFILGVKDSEHPITLYHKAGIPIIISTDDPGILRTSLTEQYTLAALRYGFSYNEIKQFVYNSIKYAFLTETDKDALNTKLDNLFIEFEDNYLITYQPSEENFGGRAD